MADDHQLMVPLERRLTLTLAQAALVAGLPEKVIRRAAADGRLRTFTVDSTTRRVRRSELEDWVNTL